MYRSIIINLIQFLEDNPSLTANNGVEEQLKADLAAFKSIDFYSFNAANEIQKHLESINTLQTLVGSIPQHSQLESIQNQLNSKHAKLLRIQNHIPRGMLDAKRAILIAMGQTLSLTKAYDQITKERILTLKTFMKNCNKEYLQLIQNGGSIEYVHEAMDSLYHKKVEEFAVLIKIAIANLYDDLDITESGLLAKECLIQALNTIPRRLSSFLSQSGIAACKALEKKGSRFFFMPSRDDTYHLDFDPEEDLADTCGNCFGEAMMFMHGLVAGSVKTMCPEPGLINYQLDQTRKSNFVKTTICEIDFKGILNLDQVFFENSEFKDGDICGIILSHGVNSKLIIKSAPAHIAVIAKLNTSQSRYKYVLFEKDFGALGLEDDDALRYVLQNHVLARYSSYTKVKLSKYTNASEATYTLMQSINPITLVQNLASKIRFFKKADESNASQSNHVLSMNN